MTDDLPPSPRNFKFQTWPGHGKDDQPTPHPHRKFLISDLAWTWKDDINQ